METYTLEDLLKEWYEKWGDAPVAGKAVMTLIKPTCLPIIDLFLECVIKGYVRGFFLDNQLWQLTRAALEIIKGK